MRTYLCDSVQVSSVTSTSNLYRTLAAKGLTGGKFNKLLFLKFKFSNTVETGTAPTQQFEHVSNVLNNLRANHGRIQIDASGPDICLVEKVRKGQRIHTNYQWLAGEATYDMWLPINMTPILPPGGGPSDEKAYRLRNEQIVDMQFDLNIRNPFNTSNGRTSFDLEVELWAVDTDEGPVDPPKGGLAFTRNTNFEGSNLEINDRKLSLLLLNSRNISGDVWSAITARTASGLLYQNVSSNDLDTIDYGTGMPVLAISVTDSEKSNPGDPSLIDNPELDSSGNQVDGDYTKLFDARRDKGAVGPYTFNFLNRDNSTDLGYIAHGWVG